MARETGIEPVTSSLGSWRSTAELLPLNPPNITQHSTSSFPEVGVLWFVGSIVFRSLGRFNIFPPALTRFSGSRLPWRLPVFGQCVPRRGLEHFLGLPFMLRLRVYGLPLLDLAIALPAVRRF